MNRRYLLVLATALPFAALSAVAQKPDPKGSQPELPKEKLVIAGHDGIEHVFDVEMAVKENQQMVGEMFRKVVPENGGMLFDWGFVRPSQMWMRNTLVPLDMVFINADGTIRTIVEHTTPRSLAIIDSRGPVRATLELAAGVTKKLNIHVGDKVKQRIFGNLS